MECPVCEGELHYAICSHNGHSRGQCSTPQCMHWIELDEKDTILFIMVPVYLDQHNHGYKQS